MKKIKRLEIYLWWTCNQKCVYCSEYSTMEFLWNKKVSKYDILKILIKYKKLGYNHVTYLWWEPFIQEVFYDALLLWKKLWFTILVTTNCTTLHIESQAKKFLPLIDELIISVEWIDKELQQEISQVKNLVHWDKVFSNIDKFSEKGLFKANIIVTQFNKNRLLSIATFLYNKWVNNISIWYPEILLKYYWKDTVLNSIAPSYTETINYLIPVITFLKNKNIFFRIVDIPFCIFPNEFTNEFFKKHTDDFDYWDRLKLKYNDKENIRWKNKKTKPRDRIYINTCKKCKYYWTCLWIWDSYEELYWISEINYIN